MSIEKATGQGSSITELSQALTYFTDRHSLVWLFAQCLNADNPREDILFLYGDGGNGKTLLLDFLRTKCTKHFHARVWKDLQALGEAGSLSEVADKIVQARVPQDCLPIPTAHLDFGLRLSGGNFLDPFYGLLKLRRDLAQPITQGYPLRFPLYDFACLWYLHKTGELTQEKVKKLFPADEVSFLLGIVDLLNPIPAASLISTAMTFGNGRLSEWFTFYKAKRGLTERQILDIEDIQTWDPERKLIYELPRLFAEDLNAGMTKEDAPKRVVLLFDNHEAFWGVQERTLAGDLYFAKDEWLRHLLVKLNLESGIVAVVAGREVPPWENATDNHFPIPKEYINQQLVEHFTPADAESYLQRIRKNPQEDKAFRHNLDDRALRQSLIAVASDQQGLVHPFYLGLCVDVVRAANRRGESLTAQDFAEAKQVTDKTRELMNRLLKYIDEDTRDAVHALSACRAFDEALYFKLGEALNFHATSASFRVLTRYSFVWQTGQQGMYRMHDLIRRSDDEKLTRLRAQTNEDQTSKSWIEQRIHTHGVLEHYYRERGEIPELIYHANRQDWERGVTEWIDFFDMALKFSGYTLCRSLLAIRNELIIPDNYRTGCVLKLEGDFLKGVARHEEARKKYLESITVLDKVILLDPNYVYAHNNKGIALTSLGTLQSDLSQHNDAIKSYKCAIKSYSEALQIAPDYASTNNNKGLALSRLGNLQSHLSHHEEAIESYQSAIKYFSEALRISPEYIDAQNNIGSALTDLGNLQSKLSQYKEAFRSFQDAIEACSAALQIAPIYVSVYNHKGIALTGLGNLQSKLFQNKEAIKSYQGAIDSYSEALLLAPDSEYIYNNMAVALTDLGDLQSNSSQYPEAIESYQGAIESCSAALQIAPDYIDAHNNKGSALSCLGALQSRLSQHKEAIKNHQNAIKSFSAALQIAPDHVFAHYNKGNALSRLGDLQLRLFQNQDAIKSCESAIESYSAVIQIAPDYGSAYYNKGNTLSRLGDLQSNSLQDKEAITSYQDAIKSYLAALRIDPNYSGVHNNKGIALSRLGELQSKLFRNQDAIKSFQDAVESYSAALEIDPDRVSAHNDRGVTLSSLGDLQSNLSQYPEAIKSYQGAIESFSEVLRLDPNYIGIHNNKGIGLSRLGNLQLKLSRHQDAIKSFQGAIESYSAALKIDPDANITHTNKGKVLFLLGSILLNLSQTEEARRNWQEALVEFDYSLRLIPHNPPIQEISEYLRQTLREWIIE
jgi:tetratricopeptide (TPR) repeat protein